MPVMNWMRGSLAKIVMWIILVAFLFLTFVWGMGNWGDTERGTTVILRVNGQEIDHRAYRKAHSLKSRLENPDLQNKTVASEFKQAVIDDLVAEILLADVADKLRLEVSMQEISDYIANSRVFHDRNGSFSAELFNSFLQRQALSERAFAQQCKQQLRRDKIFALLRDSALVEEEDLRWAYRRINRELRAVYIDLNIDDVASRFSVREEDVKTYYERNKESLGKPPEVKARHLLHALPAGHTAEDADGAKAFLATLRARIIKGALTFAKAATEHSQDDGSKSGGGDLGWLKKGEVMPDFNIVFRLKKGEISEPFKTSYGYHLFLAEDVHSGVEATLKQARPKIVRILNKRRAIPEMRRTQYKISLALKESSSLAAVAKLTGLPLKELSWFWPGKDLAGIDNDTLFINYAESLEVDALAANPLPYEDGLYYVQVTAQRQGKFNQERWQEQVPLLGRLARLAKGEAVFKDFVESLKEAADIEPLSALDDL